MKLNKLTKDKRFRYGSVSVVFTAVIVALIIVINAVFSLIATNFHLYVDMTSAQLYSLSDSSRDLLGKLDFDGKVKMIFMQEKDKIEDSIFTYEGDQYLREVHELALDYAAEFSDLIEIEYVNMYTNPGALAKYSAQGLSWQPTSVIFDNGKELFKVLSYSSFLAFDSESTTGEPIGFYGEHKITATVLALCSEKVIAYVTEGHGEAALSESFITVLESCGYEPKTVNLETISLSEIIEDEPRLVIINNPKTDIKGIDAGQRSEVDKINKILDGSYDKTSDNPTFGNLMVFGEPGTELPNLNSLLLRWGLQMNTASGDLVNETPENTFGDDETQKILPLYESAASSIGSKLTAKLRQKSNFRVAMDGTGTVTVSDVSSSGNIYTSSILNTSKGASVLAIAQNKTAVGGSIAKYNYVLVCGDSSLITDRFMLPTDYANEALMTNICRAMINETESTPETSVIEYKDYIAEVNVQRVSSAQKQAFLIFVSVVIPVILLAGGIVVYVRRRNK
ncbi:MAG: Gldg family protein [Clostridia bacterium]|nr:Gldg family protein [Clostridia bacterium]